MMLLPNDARCYALRSAVCAVLLGLSFVFLGKPRIKLSFSDFSWGILAGIAVFVLWIAPEYLGFGTGALKGDSPFDPKVCGWPLTIARLAGSAFVIAAAEELFFRKWLVNFAGFWWMVALFAIEHDRWAVGALAGVVYGLLAIKKGLACAIVAHMTTNFILGLLVISRGCWQFW